MSARETLCTVQTVMEANPLIAPASQVESFPLFLVPDRDLKGTGSQDK